MTTGTDFAGIALIVTAAGAIIGPAVNAFLLIKASKITEENKNAAIAARAEQTSKIDDVHHLVNNRSQNQDEKIDALLTEVHRLQAPGALPTTPAAKAALEARVPGPAHGADQP